jgi:TPR repeat protein
LNLVILYARGLGVEKNQEQSDEWLRRSAEGGLAEAQFQLARAQGESDGAATADALEWMRKAGTQDHGPAALQLAQWYESGQGVTADTEESLRWYRSSAEAGIADAQYHVANWIVEQGDEGHEEAFAMLLRAANQNHLEAANQIGRFYELGTGVAANPEEAVKWYRRAADRGSLDGALNLGIAYMNGTGVGTGPDIEAAEPWMRKAAEGGKPHAQFLLAAWLLQGSVGAARDPAGGLEWARRAAEQGYTVSQMLVGRLYELGAGTPADLARAHMWYATAAATGDAKGRTERDRLARKLSASQRNRSAALLREWRAKPESEE